MTIFVTRNWILVLLLTTTTTLFAQPSVEVIIQGIEEPLLQNTRLLLSIEQQKNHPLLSEGRLRRLHQKAPDEITKAIQPFGYYRSKINSYELNWVFPMSGNLKGMIQYFDGYGENLIDYNIRIRRFSIGLVIINWL